VLSRIQSLNKGQRVLVFITIMGGGVLLLVGITLLLVLTSANGEPRREAVALANNAVVREFAQLPGDNAYPAALAVAPDGTVYTGSYATGALWTINPADGKPQEVPGSRDAIGSVSGLTVAPDGTVFIVDRVSADPRTTGGDVKRLGKDGKITTFGKIAGGFLSPDDITLDRQGNVYVSDRGRAQVWRFNPDGNNPVAWWSSPNIDGVTQYQPTGLAYDAGKDAIIITDGQNNVIYWAKVADASTEVLYQHGTKPYPPGLDGVTVTPDGTVYVAALGQNGVARVDGDRLTYIAGQFRGSSDVDFAAPDRLYVTDFDAFSLAVPAVRPRLPFGLDVITLPPAAP
jgi:streptogramin lyase